MKKIYILFFLATFCVASAFALVVTGPDSACAHNSSSYSVPSGAATYSWSVTGGVVVSGVGTNAANISWGNAGAGTIIVTTTSPSNFYTLNVVIHPNPSPAISHAPYPTCPSGSDQSGSVPQHDGGNNCEKICKGNTVTYTTPLHPGSTYQWVATGQSNIITATNNATVTWDTTAYGSLMVIETNQWGCVDSAKICIEKVNLPVASFTHQANACKFSSVLFNNTSSNSTSWKWYFGDGGSSTIFSPSHSYSSAGNYTITLIAYNDCHCVDTFTSTINIDSLPGPSITCPSTVCAFDTATYSTAATGGCIYNWVVIGGTIVGPNGLPSVTVAWGAGQIGQLGLFVTGCGAVCSDTTFIQIPIVPANAVISGPNKVCAGDCATFTLPRFSGAGYTWMLSNASCGGVQSDTVCCEKVEICYPPYANCNDTLRVYYYDTFLGCGGSGIKVIRVRPHLSIIGNTTVCANALANYNSLGVICNWSVSPAGPVIIPGGPSSNININWNNTPGTYTLTAYPNPAGQVCDDSVKLLITVVAPPVKPVITGDTIICPNSTVQYCSNGNFTTSWVITGGTPATGSGGCITVNWNGTGPYVVKAYQTDVTSPFCSSDTTTQNVYAAVLAAPMVLPASATCANSNSSFVCTSLYPSGTTYTWSVLPVNAGAVIAGQGTTNATVQWGNNAPQSVSVKLTVNACNTILTTTVSLNLNPIPVVSVIQIGNICPGGSAQLQASGALTYVWSNLSNLNPTTILSAGLYQVTGTDVNGCTALSQIQVQNVSGPTASISTVSNLHFCIGGPPFTVTLCALGNVNYSYAWSGGGPNTQCQNYSAAGSYNVTVTDVTNNCTAVSNSITVTVDSCNGSGSGSCTSNGQISFTHTSCNPIYFTNTSVNTNGNYFWDFGDLTNSNLVNPVHSYSQAGYYVVSLSGYVYNTAHTDSCLLHDTAQIEIPIVADFDFTYGCYNSPVCFTDKSTHTPSSNITGWNWDFGDATTSTAQSPCHVYGVGGTYIVTLVITNGTCFDTIIDTVQIRPRPTATFSFSNPSCVNIPVVYTDGSFTNINYWQWHFGDGGTSLLQNPQHTYGLPGTYVDTLIVHDDRGCYDTTVKAITINAPVNYGNITAYPDTIVCAGTPVLLVAPACGTCLYLWSFNNLTNDSITVNTTGIYSVTLNDGSGCPYSTFIRIIVNSGPPAVILNNGKDELCLGESTMLFVPANNNWTYAWTSNDPNANGQTTSYVYPGSTPPGTYTYSVIVTDTTTGCADTSLPYTIIVHPLPAPPAITPLGSTTICFGDTVILVGTHPDPTVTFLWNTGDVNDTIFAVKNGCYNLTVKDTNGCKNMNQLCITVNPLPDLCTFYEGCFDTCAPYTICAPAGSTWQWLNNGVPIPSATMQCYTTSLSGSYSVIVTNSYGCVDTTGVLDLNLHPCNECADFEIDSAGCDSSGHQVIFYHVTNHSAVAITQVNLEVLQPHLNVAYAPVVSFVNVPAGGTSPQLSATIYNGHAEDTICFRTHISVLDSMGMEVVCCYSDTDCVILQPCPHDTVPVDTNCCYFRFISDSIWCTQTPVGTQYNFVLKIDGCGQMIIQSPNLGALTVNNPYTLVPGINTINGSYVATGPTDTVLCLTFVVNHGAVICKDTTICFPLHCGQHPLPCQWDYSPTICAGNTTSFNFFGNPVGLTINWNFPGGVPSSAIGPGPHSITYPNAGVYPFTMTLTNNNGTTTCTDSMHVIAAPVAVVTQVGNTLNAFPAGMNYQWFNGPPNYTVIPNATNQFYNPSIAGNYCVQVSNNYGCSDTACMIFLPVDGIDELGENSWSVYPNPNDGSFTLSLDLTSSEPVEMKVTDALGQTVDIRMFEAKGGKQSFYIANKKFATGIYFIQLKTENGVGLKRMMVK